MPSLEILYQDEFFIAINKPHGLLVHRSSIAADATEFAIQILRDQIGKKVWPCHRLDRKTSGVLLFALTEEANSLMQQKFANGETSKTYHAIVRGHTDESGRIDHPLTNDSGKTQEAITDYSTLKRSEIDLPFGKFETSRYSLVEVKPQTGRMHQIRKHFNHLRHPIIGDRPHGCNKQNKLFLEKWNMSTMMLHAVRLQFEHPLSAKNVIIEANPFDEFERMLTILKLQK